MPRPEITKLIAANLHAMPHPDGRPRRFMHHSQFAGGGNDPKVQSAVHQLAADHGDCFQHLLERNGYTFVHKDDPRPADAETYKTARIKCGRCGKELLTIGVGADMTATFSRIALRNLNQLNPECPHG